CVDGKWHLCGDGVTRPVVDANVFDAAGQAHWERFLIDSGADQTIFTTALFAALGFPIQQDASLIVEGIGGNSPTVEVPTQIEFTGVDGATVIVRGPYSAFTDPAASDISLLGRDVLNNFDVILSRRRKEVALLALNHHYHVSST